VVIAPQPVTVEQCDTCKYYRVRTYGTDPNTKTAGECRFSDPFAQGAAGYWPQVQATDWCGKYIAVP
jgi:hypothetical protein